MNEQEHICPSIQLGIRKDWGPFDHGTKEWWRDYRRFVNQDPYPGTAKISPSEGRAGELTTFTLTFIVGKGGISPYGHIAIECPFTGIEVWVPGKRYKARVPVVAVSCSNPEPFLEISFSNGILDIINRVHSLLEGDTVTVAIGDERRNPVALPAIAFSYKIPIALDIDNTGYYKRIEEFPILKIRGNYPSTIYLVVPSKRYANANPSVRIRALDVYGNPASNYKGEPELYCLSESSEGKTEVTSLDSVSREDSGPGYIEVPIDRLPKTDGICRIGAVDREIGISGLSNPVVLMNVLDAAGPSYSQYNLYFGDIHGHNEHCDGIGTADEYYRWARDVRFLDFCSLTNHVEGAKRFNVEDFWETVRKKAAEYNDPGRFVTFLGFEWGSWEEFGDKCVYYNSDNGTYFSAHDERSNTPEKLWEKLKGLDVMTVPHHPKYGGKTDWRFHDTELQPLVEIFSTWGSSEYGSETAVRRAWEKGYKLGVIASSDTHTGTPGNDWCGLAAVWAPELTRDSIFNALQNRQCYGTTGARINLCFTINDAMMGRTISVDVNDELVFSVFTAGTAPIQTVELFGNNECIKTWFGDGRMSMPCTWSCTVQYLVPEIHGLCEDFYYVRVTQEDGNIAWSSPIWIRSK